MNITGVPVKFECNNCESVFDHEAHLSHICEYGADKEYNSGNNTKASSPFRTSKVMNLLKNNLRHLNSIIDEFPGESTDGKVNKSYNCKICKRSYVHASGLARHLKSHGTNLERLAKTRAVSKKIDDVQVSCQCVFCGRIFSSVSRGLRHYKIDHGLTTRPDGGDNKENQPMENKNDQNKDDVSIYLSNNAVFLLCSLQFYLY